MYKKLGEGASPTLKPLALGKSHGQRPVQAVIMGSRIRTWKPTSCHFLKPTRFQFLHSQAENGSGEGSGGRMVPERRRKGRKPRGWGGKRKGE